MIYLRAVSTTSQKLSIIRHVNFACFCHICARNKYCCVIYFMLYKYFHSTLVSCNQCIPTLENQKARKKTLTDMEIPIKLKVAISKIEERETNIIEDSRLSSDYLVIV